ncbi:MAG: PDZ domain-containing protein [Verrucomicrobia bacterium]|nr:MAG: PDZ domain-containing protein [Verrucomicrobiota bacterium]
MIRHQSYVLLCWACFHYCAHAQLPLGSLAMMASDEFSQREKAQQEILDWSREQPQKAKLMLLKMWREGEDPEIRERCYQVLKTLVIDDYLSEGQGFLGIQMQLVPVHLPKEPRFRHGIKITRLLPEGAAASSELREQDVLVGMNKLRGSDPDFLVKFSEAIRALKPKTKVELTVLRDAALLKISVRLGRRPLAADQPFAGTSEELTRRMEEEARDAYFEGWLSKQNL